MTPQARDRKQTHSSVSKDRIKSKGEKYLDITIDKDDLPKVEKMIKKIK